MGQDGLAPRAGTNGWRGGPGVVWRGLGALALVLLISGGPGAAARAASLTWGYNFQRDRVASAPIASEAVPRSAGGTIASVVPLYGQSQSTPVVYRRHWYEWTYWDERGDARGALWTGTLSEVGGSTRATPITLPGQSAAVLSAVAGEVFAQPSDAAISPGGAWVAFSAGKYLYWWPRRDPRAGARVLLVGPEDTAANSTSPTFVPDPHVASGWAVCDGNWDGAFDCFAIAAGPYHPALSWYLVTMTVRADGDGYTPITSSAAYDPATGDVFFGVASWHDPRVIQMDPLTGVFRVLDGRGCPCAGVVEAPVSSAVAVAGGAVFASDSSGNVYRFAAVSGRVTAVYRPAAGGGVDIVSPAVAHHVVYMLENGYRQVVALDADTLQPLGSWSVGAGQAEASAVTVAEDASVPDELVYGQESGGVGVAIPECRLVVGLAVGSCADTAGAGWSWLGQWPGAPTDGAGYDFTAPVVDGPDVLLWSDTATSYWLSRGDGRAVVAPPAGDPLARTPGGMQVYQWHLRLSAFISADPPGTGPPSAVAVVGRTAPRVYLLQPPGARATVTWFAPGAAVGESVVLRAAGRRQTTTSACQMGGSPAPGLGAFPSPVGPWPTAGCGPLSRDYAQLTNYASQQSGLARPGYGGTAPSAWRDAGAAFAVSVGRLAVPTVIGAYRVAVTSRLADGGVRRVTIWYEAGCPGGYGADLAGRCGVCLSTGQACCPRAGCTLCASGAVRGADGHCHRRPGRKTPTPAGGGPPEPAVGGTGGCPSGGPCGTPACPSDVVPGVFGMTRREYALLCQPPGAWLVDPAVVRCYGSWWQGAERQSGAVGCVDGAVPGSH